MAVNIVGKIDEKVKINNVIISVSDKSGLDSFVPGLVAVNPGIMIYSTGGTYKEIKAILKDKADNNLMEVSAYTGQPEMQGGLVKTLDFKIYLGLLSETYNEAHQKDLARTRAAAIDMIVSNLYPFTETVTKSNATPENARANIDIGGPCMVRASAKNFLRVASVTEPGDYEKILAELKKEGGYLTLKTRYMLSAKAFDHTARYDKAISDYFHRISFKQVEDCYTITR